MSPLNFKVLVYKQVKNHLLEKVELLLDQQAQIRFSLSSETKSTAGDKHHTARAQMQAENDKIEKQIALTKQMLQHLHDLPKEEKNTVSSGALVYTNKGIFYFSVPLGKINVQEKEIFALSLAAPISKAFLGKSSGETITFNNQIYSLENIE